MGENKKIRCFLDLAPAKKNRSVSNLDQAREIIEDNQTGKIKPILFSRGKRIESFFTEDSKLYISPKDSSLLKEGTILNKNIGAMDSVASRIVGNYLACRPNRKSYINKFLLEKYNEASEKMMLGYDVFQKQISPTKLWNATVIGAILFGMISMTFIYRYLGQGAFAEGIQNNQPIAEETVLAQNGVLVQEQDAEEKSLAKTELEKDEVEYISQILDDFEDKKKDDFEKKVKKMVKGYPIEKMVPYILEKDKIVAAFLVGIARKESGWGEHVPVLNGKDCYNYWGYRGIRDRMGTGGHTCFDSPKDAVDTVAKRIDFLVSEKNLNTPAKMSIWKCGSACSKDKGVKKWISDVDLYFQKLNN